MRILETAGALKGIWPQSMEAPTVEEVQLRFGDFFFGLGEKRLDVAIERKQIQDLVQRSTCGDHWKQLGKMRHNFPRAVLLIKVDP
jgi:ERCC4-type nuclease